jgi:hypothetical protein
VIGDLLREQKLPSHAAAYMLNMMIEWPSHTFIISELSKKMVLSRAITFKYLKLFSHLNLLVYSKYRYLGSRNKVVYKFRAGPVLLRRFNDKLPFIDSLLEQTNKKLEAHKGKLTVFQGIPLETAVLDPKTKAKMRFEDSDETVRLKKDAISISMSNRVLKNKEYEENSINDKLNKRHSYINSQNQKNHTSNIKNMIKPNKKYGEFNESDYQAVIDDFNTVGRFVNPDKRTKLSPAVTKLIDPLLKMGYTLESFKAAHRGLHSSVWHLKRGLYSVKFLYSELNFQKFVTVESSSEIADEDADDPSKLSRAELNKRILSGNASTAEWNFYHKRSVDENNAKEAAKSNSKRSRL